MRCLSLLDLSNPQRCNFPPLRTGNPSFIRFCPGWFETAPLSRALDIELNHPPNLERLVIDVIEANLCNQILILLHFSRSTRLAFLCTAPISKIQLKIAANFAKLNIENSIGASQFLQENCYFSLKSRWNFVGISRTCSKISKFTEECRKFAKFWEIFLKIPQLIEKFNRKDFKVQ